MDRQRSLDAARTKNGRRRIEGAALAQFAQSLHESSDPQVAATDSTRNHFTGIVTKVVKDKVMAQVELQAGPFRVVALISREAVDDMGLVPGRDRQRGGEVDECVDPVVGEVEAKP